ncbi:ABC transporter substrate-binding protein [Arthrobacter alpinus]|nr:ABC transporter substrate-binding protein [Arthrobacter alpinus]
MRTYLANNGLSEAQIKQVQLVVLPPNDTEQAIRRGQIDAGSLGSVLQDKALATGGLRALFTDVEFFGSFPGGQYVFRDDFIKENPHGTNLHNRCGQGHRVGNHHPTCGRHSPIHQDHSGPRPQRKHRCPAVLEERGRSQRRSYRRQALHALGRLSQGRRSHQRGTPAEQVLHQRFQ